MGFFENKLLNTKCYILTFSHVGFFLPIISARFKNYLS